MIPGEFIIKEGTIEYNKGKEAIKLGVVNTGDRPIQIGSHYHFYEVNDYLKFDREKAYGTHLDIASGTSVRFEPGEEKEVNLVEFGGSQRVFGFNGLTEAQINDTTIKRSLDNAKIKGFIK